MNKNSGIAKKCLSVTQAKLIIKGSRGEHLSLPLYETEKAKDRIEW